ncbi:MAG: SMI1/KNR4 family protein [Armatimonadota bacterium]|nr:SMI1/KNR4 family protein [Armatimonadota bacterium]
MTDEDLKRIETALGITIPASYRAAIHAEDTFGLFDSPDAVIGYTQAPLSEGDYDGANWRPSYVAIGDSGAGDLYFIDAAREPSPVFCLSHEDHMITQEAPSLAAFMADARQWLAQDTERRRAEAEAAHGRGQRRRQFLAALFGLILLFPATIGLMDVAGRFGFAHHGATLLVPVSVVVFVLLVRLLARAVRGGIHV